MTRRDRFQIPSFFDNSLFDLGRHSIKIANFTLVGAYVGVGPLAKLLGLGFGGVPSSWGAQMLFNTTRNQTRLCSHQQSW